MESLVAEVSVQAPLFEVSWLGRIVPRAKRVLRFQYLSRWVAGGQFQYSLVF